MGVYTNSGNLPQFSSNSRDYPSFFWFWERILLNIGDRLSSPPGKWHFIFTKPKIDGPGQPNHSNYDLINLIKRISSQAKLALARIISWSRSILIFSNSLLHYNLQMIQHEVLGTLHVNIKLQINKI